MRIGIDLYAMQAPSCRHRGIGRYAGSLIGALVGGSPPWDFVCYRRADLELVWDHSRDPRVSRWVDVEPDAAGAPDGTLQQIVNDNPHDLDWLLIPNPVVERRRYALPEVVPGGPRLAAVVHDFIPALFPQHYLKGADIAREYAGDLRRLRSYDLLLANSEATRRDTITHLGVPGRRTANLSAAVDRGFFRPDDTCDQDAQRLGNLKLDRPFLYYLGNVDWRKNILGLLEAYALVPIAIRERSPLVLTFGENAWFDRMLAEKIAALGLAGSVLATGPVDDLTARALYRRCTLFLSPSLYEGFGLPILEAMSCGAAVIAADNSSQPEVVGSAGVLVKTADSAAWAEVLARCLLDPSRLAAMKHASLAQAESFSWENSAQRLRCALESAPKRQSRPNRSLVVAHPTLATSAFDPAAARVFRELCDNPGTIAILDPTCAPALPPIPVATPWHDIRVLDRVHAAMGKPPITHVVDRLEDASPLSHELSRRSATVIFASPASLCIADDLMRKITRHASTVFCRSPELYARLRKCAEDDVRERVQMLATREGVS